MTFKIFLSLLIMRGVFGSEDEGDMLSEMKGDSVTLNINLSETQGFNLIQWRFGGEGSTIARSDGNEISYAHDELFRDGLQLNQTGSLTITNMISESVIDAGDAETKSVAVKEGDTVTLQTDITELHGDELIVWRFGGEGKLIAKNDIETKSSALNETTDERFRDRLQLNDQTGSLTIKNMKNTDSGLYTVEISSSRQMINERFIVTVSGSGVSSGAIAGILIFFLLVIVIVFYYRRKNYKIQIKTWTDYKMTMLVKEGEDVTLHTDADIEAHDQILWTFEAQGARLAEIRKGTRETYDGADGIFRDRLMLDETGSLTIRNIEIGHDGVYILQIKKCFTRRFPLYKKFTVTVNDRTISVMEGDDVTLNTDTELSKEKEIKWLFGDQIMKAPIAEINGETGEIFTYEGKADGRFRNRLKLDPLTGSLSIKNTSPEHSGYYELQIKDCGGVLHRLLMVSVRERRISVENGNSVTLETEIQKDDQILWMFGAEETLIAQIKGETRETHDVADGRFRNRLKLEESGSLSISNITTEHTGVYKAQIISRGSTSYKKFKVVMLAEYVPVKKGDAVTLHTDSKIQKNDQIQWMFGDKYLIAEIKEGTGEISTYEDVLDGRFRDRLKLDEQTGSLTITNFRTQHTGLYKMKINRSTETPKNKSFDVFARGDKVNESVTKVKSLSDGDNLDVVNEQR